MHNPTIQLEKKNEKRQELKLIPHRSVFFWGGRLAVKPLLGFSMVEAHVKIAE